MPFRFALALLLALACSDPSPPDEPADSGPATDSSAPPVTDASADLSVAADGPDGGPADMGSGLSPVFVAVGDGGWTATSCDLGRSWEVQQQSEERGDHSEWTSFGGVAYGNETFVSAFGWGAVGHVMVSADGGRGWDLAEGDFAADEALRSGAAGVVHDGREFVLFIRGRWRSTDGVTWERTERALPPGTHQVRQVRGFADEQLIVLSAETQREGSGRPVGNFVVVSEDGGETWSEGAGYDSACSHPIQHRGDIEVRGDTVLVGAGSLCRSTDRGVTWAAGPSPTGSDISDLYRDEDAFYLVARGSSELHRSVDGDAWEATGAFDADAARAAYGASTHVIVGYRDGARVFLYSDDGAEFTEGAAEDPFESTPIRDLAFGYAPCD